MVRRVCADASELGRVSGLAEFERECEALADGDFDFDEDEFDE